MHLIGDRFRGRVLRKAIEVNRVEPCLFCAHDVGVEVVSNHDCGLRRGTRLLKSIVEELLGRFVGSSIFAENDGGEVVEESTRVKFLVLHFVEAIAAHVHPIAFVTKVIHQFLGTIDQARLDGTEA